MNSNDSIRVTVEARVAELTAAAERIRSDIQDLVNRRESLMLTAHAELIAAGVPAFVISRGISRPSIEGDKGTVIETFFEFHGVRDRVEMSFRPTRGSGWEVGGHMTSCGALISYGEFEVLLTDGDSYLVAQIGTAEMSETAHRRAISRLRTQARNQGISVKVHDRAVKLVTPTNHCVHEGDAISAYKWITGNLNV